MATIIQVKRTTTANLPSTLEQGELAYIYDTSATDTDAGGNGGRLYIGDPTTNTNTPLKIGGKYYTDLMDHAPGTLTASAAAIVDANSKIGQWNVDNLRLDGNVLSSTNSNGDIEITPNGSGKSVVTNLYIDASTSLQEYIEDISGGSVTAGEGIDVTYDDGAGTTTISGEDATTSNKGIASFSSSDFSVTSGAVSIATGGVSNDQLAGSITNAKLSNSSITIGSDAVSLGATQTDLNGLTSVDVDNITIDGNTISTTDANGDLVLSPNGTGAVDVNSSRITNVTDPSGDQDAATKAYVDSVANGLDVKDSVRASSTANLAATYDNGAGTLTASANGALTLDGVSVSQGDRVLVKDQSTATQNGIYTVTTVGDGSTAFVLTRSPDADTASELTGGTFFFVEEGTDNADNGYVATHNGVPTFGSTSITFSQFSGAGSISAGDALTKTGNQLNVAVDDSSIEISSDALQVKASGITNAMLAGSIANAKLTNSSVTINTNSVALGASLTLDTDDIGEGSTNLYYTDTRSRSALSITANTGLAYNSSTGAFSGVNATTSIKGVASFSSDNFTVSSGAVSISEVDGGTY